MIARNAPEASIEAPTPATFTIGDVVQHRVFAFRGVIFDVGSLKSPLRGGLMALKSHGCRVASVHPMFGPDTELLSGRHVIFIDLGHDEALAAVKELFTATMVTGLKV